MQKNNSLHFNTGLVYEKAGLVFRVKLDLPEDPKADQGATLSIHAEDLTSGDRVPFSNEACPALADFVAGYPRWLVRVGIKAIAGDDEITGTTRADQSIEALLETAGQVCDMIDQKFSLYKELVVRRR